MVALAFDIEVASGEKPDVAACQKYLRLNGRVLIQLLDTPPASGVEIFKRLTQSLGKTHEHDSVGTTLWDVKLQPNNTAGALARSLTMKEFPMHTDGCFEEPAPDYIGLYVLKADALGGGMTHLIDSADFLHRLSGQTLDCLRNTSFPMRVPEEFYKGKRQVALPILTDGDRFRFREELMIREQCSGAQNEAIDELNGWLNNHTLMRSIYLPTSSIILLDNGRYFHARSAVNDPERHLLRLRFYGTGDSVPVPTKNLARHADS